MNKSVKMVTVILILVISGLVGIYAYRMNRVRTEISEAKPTPVQLALSRDLDKDYPPTVKEVVKYYTDIEKCLFNEECTNEEIEALGTQARKLYDDDLRASNDAASNLERLKDDVKLYKDSKWKLGAVSVAGSASVDYFREDDYEFARIYCGYSVKDSKGRSNNQSRIYLLRQDEKGRWKIYGWKAADKVNMGQE